jgi:hypothetical protein
MNELLRQRRSRARRGAPARAPAARPASTAAKGLKPAKRVVAGPKSRAAAAPRRFPARKAARAPQGPAQGGRRRVVKQ